MFSFHETTQRRVCRTAFVAGCVLPTLCAVVWTAFLHRPWRENDWQQTLREQLHVQATVGEVSSPYPGVTQLRDVQFADLRTERLLGSIGELRIEGWKSLLVADRIEISAAQLPEFAIAIATWVSSEELPALQLQAEAVRFVGPDGESFEVKNVRLRSLVNGNAHKQIELHAEPSGLGQGGTSSTIQLVVEHHAGQAEPTVYATLDTQQANLPAWLLADLVPGMKGCSSAQFTGQLEIESMPQTVGGSMRGRLDEIDLEQWVDSSGIHRLQATASLELNSLRWRDDRIELVQGYLRARDGSVSLSLIDKFTELLFCVPSASLEKTKSNFADEMIAFDELACGFRINDEGISISGLCDTAENVDRSECLLVKDGQPLLLQPRSPVLPVACLVQTLLLPETSVSWLPATQEANSMGDVLPLPHGKRIARQEDLEVK